MRHHIRAWKHRVMTSCGLASSLHAKELLYQELFGWLCERNGLTKRFDPVRSAANHSLLWLLGRILEENELSSIIELGAGQTTLLLDGLCRESSTAVLTLEADPFWAKEMGAKVEHEVRLAPLVPSRREGRELRGYDLSSLSAEQRFDLVLVDGPRGTRGLSRAGCLDLLDRHLADDFVVLFDDAQRVGERRTIDVCRRLLRARAPELHEVEVTALKRQVVFASERYRRVVHC